MPSITLVGYATSYGSTKEVAEAVAAALRECGRNADVRPAREVAALDPYGAVILGAPLVMPPAGAGLYVYTLSAEEIPDYAEFREAWVQYRLVAYNSAFKRISKNDIFSDVEFAACGV